MLPRDLGLGTAHRSILVAFMEINKMLWTLPTITIIFLTFVSVAIYWWPSSSMRRLS